jgi:hypothetical protein
MSAPDVPYTASAVPPLHVPDAITALAARFRANPAFQDAVRLNAESLLGFYEGHPLLNKLVSEEARWMIGGFAMFLHFTRDPDDPTSGATPARIQQLCATYRIASPGRVTAMIGLMQLGGHLVQKRVDSDRRVRRLEPTEEMLAYARPHLAAHLGPLDLLCPGAGYLGHFQRNPEFLARYYREAGRLYFAGVRLFEALPRMRMFTGRDAGYMILLRMWLSDREGRLPPRILAPQSFQELGRRFGVSRAHVRALVETCCAEGLMRSHAEGGREIEILPPLVDQFEDCLALQLAFMEHCARTAAGPDSTQ